MHSQPANFVDKIEEHVTSGTDGQPNSTPISGIMTVKGRWMLMFHGEVFLNDVQQSGTRGGDKLFSTNWIMPMAQRKFAVGRLTLRAMLSFEPGTVTGRFYPELFQQGETAFGKPIVDGQHPHDFPMELAALYDLRLAKKTLLSFYLAPVGDPAMGPVAYPHRASASEDTMAPLGHHLQDSTHVADDVVTVGLTHRALRLEASGFHGREPDEFRWDVDSGRIDSWSSRVTINPSRDWSAQYSFGHLTGPEALHPNEDIDRMTASAAYNHQLRDGNLAALLLWGRNRNRPDGLVWNSLLAESTLKFHTRNYGWMRFEDVDRTSELLSGGALPASTVSESIAGRVQAITIGYDREYSCLPHVATAIGGQATFYRTPDALKAAYGSHPLGVTLFIRLRPSGHMMR